jgi:hypothetical protein
LRKRPEKTRCTPAEVGPTISADVSKPIGKAHIRKKPETKPITAKIGKLPVSAKSKACCGDSQIHSYKGLSSSSFIGKPGINIEPNIPPTIIIPPINPHLRRLIHACLKWFPAMLVALKKSNKE